jgi:hypothetical protein
MVLTYFLNDFEMVPVAPIITGITLVFTFHICFIIIIIIKLRWLLYIYRIRYADDEFLINCEQLRMAWLLFLHLTCYYCSFYINRRFK